MSVTAPTINLAVDWCDSPMLEGASDSERLAWVCLLCYAKLCGRAGRVAFRESTFCALYRLPPEAVSSMLERARLAGAVEVCQHFLKFAAWSKYQDTHWRTRNLNSLDGVDVTTNAPDFLKASSASGGGRGGSAHSEEALASGEGNNQRTQRAHKTFTKPTVDEINAYCTERANHVNPQEFFDHYEAAGWVRARGVKITDWKACVRTWERDRSGNVKPEQKSLMEIVHGLPPVR